MKVIHMSFVIIVAISLDLFTTVAASGMWTAMGQKSHERKCVSPCRIFHTWCKNDGKCREKGADCTWYCECPDNCEGFFCEKVLQDGVDAAPKEGEHAVAVDIVVEKEKKKKVSAFDKSKLAQALAGIINDPTPSKTEDSKIEELQTIERVDPSAEISVKETITKQTKIYVNCSEYNDTGTFIKEASPTTLTETVNTTQITPFTGSPINESITLTPALNNQESTTENITSEQTLIVSNTSDSTAGTSIPPDMSEIDSTNTIGISSKPGDMLQIIEKVLDNVAFDNSSIDNNTSEGSTKTNEPEIAPVVKGISGVFSQTTNTLPEFQNNRTVQQEDNHVSINEPRVVNSTTVNQSNNAVNDDKPTRPLINMSSGANASHVQLTDLAAQQLNINGSDPARAGDRKTETTHMALDLESNQVGPEYVNPDSRNEISSATKNPTNANKSKVTVNETTESAPLEIPSITTTISAETYTVSSFTDTSNTTETLPYKIQPNETLEETQHFPNTDTLQVNLSDNLTVLSNQIPPRALDNVTGGLNIIPSTVTEYQTESTEGTGTPVAQQNTPDDHNSFLKTTPLEPIQSSNSVNESGIVFDEATNETHSVVDSISSENESTLLEHTTISTTSPSVIKTAPTNPKVFQESVQLTLAPVLQTASTAVPTTDVENKPPTPSTMPGAASTTAKYLTTETTKLYAKTTTATAAKITTTNETNSKNKSQPTTTPSKVKEGALTASTTKPTMALSTTSPSTATKTTTAATTTSQATSTTKPTMASSTTSPSTATITTTAATTTSQATSTTKPTMASSSTSPSTKAITTTAAATNDTVSKSTYTTSSLTTNSTSTIARPTDTQQPLTTTNLDTEFVTELAPTTSIIKKTKLISNKTSPVPKSTTTSARAEFFESSTAVAMTTGVVLSDNLIDQAINLETVTTSTTTGTTPTRVTESYIATNATSGLKLTAAPNTLAADATPVPQTLFVGDNSQQMDMSIRSVEQENGTSNAVKEETSTTKSTSRMTQTTASKSTISSTTPLTDAFKKPSTVGERLLEDVKPIVGNSDSPSFNINDKESYKDVNLDQIKNELKKELLENSIPLNELNNFL